MLIEGIRAVVRGHLDLPLDRDEAGVGRDVGFGPESMGTDLARGVTDFPVPAPRPEGGNAQRLTGRCFEDGVEDHVVERIRPIFRGIERQFNGDIRRRPRRVGPGAGGHDADHD
jgi:hypothetical protein